MPDRAGRWPLVAAALGCALAAACLGQFGKAPRATGGFLFAYAAAFLPYAAAVRLAFRPGARIPFGLVVATALAARLLVFPAAPSDDVNRTLWEGRVQAQGVNPYRVSPADPRLAPLRDEVWRGVNHPDLPAIYPPATQIAQRLAHAAGLGAPGWKAAMAALDLLVILALGALLRARGAPPGRAVVYAWSPLAIFQTAGRGHHEPLLLLPLIAAAILLGERAPAPRAARMGAGALAALAAMAKWSGLPLLFVWGRRLSLAGLATAAAAGILVTLPYADAGGEIFTALRRFHADFHFVDSINAVLGALAGARAARVICAAALAVVALWLARREADPARGARVLFGAMLLLSPTVHPWYFLWVLPWLALGRPWGWLALTATVPLYVGLLEVIAGPAAELREVGWWKALAWAPAAAIWAAEGWKARARKGPT